MTPAGPLGPRTFDVAQAAFREAVAEVNERPLRLAARQGAGVGCPDPLRRHLEPAEMPRAGGC